MTLTFLPAPELPPGRPLLVLTGLMGVGKSVAGRLAAGALAFPFVDLDDVVGARAGAPVREVFEERGEDGFRALERGAVFDAGRLSGAVVATGGGAPMHASSFSTLAHGAVVAVLTCRPDELARRLEGSAGSRPLLGGTSGPALVARIGSLLAERSGAYRAAGQALDTSGLTPARIAEALVGRYREQASVGPTEPVVIDARGPSGPYPIVIGSRAAKGVGRLVASRLGLGRSVAVVADAAVQRTHAGSVADDLVAAGLRVCLRATLPAGEAAKSIRVVADLWDRFREAGLGPDGIVVAVGGGATLDAAGFAAATFARGVPLVNVPTTLLAMLDAALGGKTAVDHGGTKNLAGALHHPHLVVADPYVLSTLPRRALRAGLAEAVKAFILASPLALDVVERADRPDPAWVIEQAVRIKAAIIGLDPFDRSLRRSLNLGHTYAHAVESAAGHTVLHGEAVAVGLVAAARLGESLALTQHGTSARLSRLLAALDLPVAVPPGMDRRLVLRALDSDKKRRQGRPVFVVPAPGGAVAVDDVPLREALAALFDAESAEARR